MVKAFTTNINGKIDIEFLTLAQETERKLKEMERIGEWILSMMDWMDVSRVCQVKCVN